MDIMNQTVAESNSDIADVQLKYRLLAENTGDCVWLYDLKNERYKYISPAIFQLRGITVQEAMQQGLYDALTPGSLKRADKTMRTRTDSFLKGDRSEDTVSGSGEYELYSSDGSVKNIEISTKLLFNDESGGIDILGVSRDITDRKMLEWRLNDEIARRDKAIKKLQEYESKLVRITDELTEKNKALKAIAITDELTGLKNRYYLDSRLLEEMERADRYSLPLTMIIFDLDYFKRINDNWGHDFGDKVLSSIAATAKKLVRRSDTIARWGGEEFAILAPETNLDGATGLAEKIRKAIANIVFSEPVQVTASFGVGEWMKGESYESWFRRVDQALYRAKHKGRNCVVQSSGVELMPIAMVKLHWKPEWECGISSVDQQHRKLVDMANKLIEATKNDANSEKIAGQLDSLIRHVVHHFEHEEKMLELIGFPEAVRHAGIHRELVEKAGKLRQEYLNADLKPSAFFAFLVDEVVVGHLLAEDIMFFPYTRLYTDGDKTSE